MSQFILAIDQGTTSSRALVFNKSYEIVGLAQHEFTQHFPNDGWVEHDPEEIWSTTLQAISGALSNAEVAATDIVAIGITNQRETTVVWDRRTGEPLYNAIVWQDRRTADWCHALKTDGKEAIIAEKTGLLLDPYFSATKINWIINTVPGAKQKAAEGHLAFGTIDCFLLWRLTGGKVHATDATNAARTSLFNIREHRWDEELLSIFNIPASMLPEVKDNCADFGITEPDILGSSVPITAMAGDQQSAAVGQACFEPGMLKSTYGTGCFALLNTGPEFKLSKNKLLTTIAYRLNGEICYALEGSIFIAGAAVQWLRDGLKIIADALESTVLADQADRNQHLYLVPAFTGLGAPYWDSEARGAIFGLTRNSGPAEFSKAALEAVCYQTSDLLSAMKEDWPSLASQKIKIRVDGGMAASDWTMQFLADILDSSVERPPALETTALGAAYLAGRHVGFYPDLAEFSRHWSCDKHFDPHLDEGMRQQKLAGWHDAVTRTLSKV